MASPITGEDLGPISNGLLACDHLAELSATRTKFQTFLEWMVQNSGEFTAEFISDLLEQILYDPAKLNFFLRTNPSTGKLELIEKIPLTGLDATTGADGDTLVIDGGVWITRASQTISLAPTSGGVTVPDPDAGGTVSVAHGLGATPMFFGCKLECTVDDASYTAGDVVDGNCLIQVGSGGEVRPALVTGVSSTLVFAVFSKEGAAARKYVLVNKTTGDIDTNDITPGSWNVKLWASL